LNKGWAKLGILFSVKLFNEKEYVIIAFDHLPTLTLSLCGGKTPGITRDSVKTAGSVNG